MSTRWTRRWSLPADDQAPRQAREAMRAALAAHPHRDDIVAVGSELVTNAIRHGRPPISLTVTSDGERVRIEVRQAPSGKQPVLLPADPTDAGGRGLPIVERLSRDWGWIRGDDHLVVWAEFG